jgi:DNA-binding NarL/FixJ family response regulator
MRGREVRHRLIGRRAELRLVEAALAACAETPGLLVAGEAGIGKTRLVLEAARRAEARGATAIGGSCLHGNTGAAPFVPFVEAFGRLGDQLGERADAVLGPEGRELRDVLSGREGGPTTTSRLRQFEAARAVLERAGSPLVLVVEDVQWIDPSSLSLLAYLVRKARRCRLAVVATLRSGTLDRDDPVVLTLAELAASGRLARLDLGPLSSEDADDLIADLDPSATTATRELARSRGDGNPLLIRELVAAGCESVTEIPATLRDLLLARAQGSRAATRAVVEAAAVIGRPFDSAILDLVLDGPADEVSAGLWSALERGLLVGAPGSRTVRLSHALLGEVVAADLDPLARSRLHARLAAVLEGRPDLALRTAAGAANEIAAHWLAAALPDRALAAVVRAARLTAGLPASVEAHRLYGRALDLWDIVAAPEETASMTHAALLEEAGEAAFQAGDVMRSAELVRRAIAACRPGDAASAGRLEAVLAKRLAWAYDIDAMEVAAQRAVELTEESPASAARGLALAALASALMHRGRYRRADGLARQAGEIAAGAGDLATEAWALAVHAECLGQLGDDEAGLVVADRAVEVADRSGDGWAWWVAHGDRRDLLWVLGWHPERAERAIRSGRLAASRVGLAGPFATDWRWGELNLWYGLGRWDDVEAATTALAANPAPSGGAPVAVWSRALRGTVRVLRGALESGEADLTASLEAVMAVSEGLLARPRRGLAESALLRGEPARAIELVDAELADFAESEGVLDRAHLGALGLRACADLAEARRARRDAIGASLAVAEAARYAALVADARSGPDGVAPPGAGLAAYGALADAEARRVRGRSDPDAWAVAAVALARWSRPWLTAYARFREAEAALARTVDRERAGRALEDASARAAALAARPLLERIERLARRARLGLQAVEVSGAPHGSVAGWALSPRERQVLGYLVEGRTNREIGAALFIAETTASVHVSHILDKLGVDSRGAAAALAARAGFEPEGGQP